MSSGGIYRPADARNFSIIGPTGTGLGPLDRHQPRPKGKRGESPPISVMRSSAFSPQAVQTSGTSSVEEYPGHFSAYHALGSATVTVKTAPHWGHLQKGMERVARGGGFEKHRRETRCVEPKCMCSGRAWRAPMSEESTDSSCTRTIQTARCARLDAPCRTVTIGACQTIQVCHEAARGCSSVGRATDF